MPRDTRNVGAWPMLPAAHSRAVASAKPAAARDVIRGAQVAAVDARSAPMAFRFSKRGAAVRLFLTCWLLYGLHFATNTVREIYPALSLGDHLSFDVSEYVGFHPDIFEVPGRGAFINNNPGASIVGAIPYVLTRPLIDAAVGRVRQTRAGAPSASGAGDYDTIYPMAHEFYRKARERGLDVKFGLAAGVMQALAMAPLSALGAVVMFYLLASQLQSARTAVLLALLYAFATPVFYRSAQLNHNLLVADCALFGFALLWRPWAAPAGPAGRHYLAAGLLAGWAVVCDYSGLIVVVVLAGYALVRWRSAPAEGRSLRDVALFGTGLAVCGAVLMAYQWVCFGDPLLPAQRVMPVVAFTNRGYSGMDWPQWDLLWETGFSIRFGLFTSAPLLLLALYPPAWLARTRIMGCPETWCVGIFCALFLLFCSANQYGRMQFNCGVRHIVPVVPFLFLIVAGILIRMPRLAVWSVGIVSLYWSWCLAMYRDVEQGLGVFESIIHVTRDGPQLPWLKTLQGMGYVSSQAPAVFLLLAVSVVVWAMWGIGRSATTASREWNHQEA
jgi:hypothetical protein